MSTVNCLRTTSAFLSFYFTEGLLGDEVPYLAFVWNHLYSTRAFRWHFPPQHFNDVIPLFSVLDHFY